LNRQAAETPRKIQREEFLATDGNQMHTDETQEKE
jgi:hypothetical protein